MENREISQAVVSRLPRYYRYLGDLKDQGIERISSAELSRIMRVTASQIRQDFNHFGGFGQQGYGYNVEYLHEEIGKILGLDRDHRLVLVGAGNLGSALINYMNFKNRGFFFQAAFDANEELHGRTLGGIKVYPMDELVSFIENNDIEIVVLAIPRTAAVKVAEMVSGTGISAIWNFAHIDLQVPDRIQVENVHLSDSLMRLTYSIRRYEEKNAQK